MADRQDDSTVPKGLAKAGPTEMARALTRIADAVGMGTGIHLCEDVPGAVELLVATHEDLKRELEVRRPRDEAEATQADPAARERAALRQADAALERIRLVVGADPEADASEIADAVWREDRDQERRRLWVHVAEKAVGPTPAGGHRDGTSAAVDADQVLAGFDAAFGVPMEPKP